MTKRELSDFFGNKYTDCVGRCFIYCENICESIKQKKGHYNKNMEVDYTLEETLLALSHYKEANPRFAKFAPTPAMIQLLKENFIHRDKPYKLKEKKIKLTQDQQVFIYLYNTRHYYSVCVCCAFLDARNMNRIGNPSPYCTLYECFLNKIQPRRNIYQDCCSSFRRSQTPLTFTSEGVKTIDELNGKKINSDMLGIPQSSFKSKRKRGEPITILKDGFETEY